MTRSSKTVLRGVFHFFVGLLPIALWALFPAVAGPIADYGDAPDGVGGDSYPSLFGTPNAGIGLDAPYHLDVTREWLGLGPPPTTTTTEADSKQVDLDEDNAAPSLFRFTAAGIGTRGYVFTPITFDPGLSSASDIRYLNTVVDFNKDGDFGDILPGQREWVVRNQVIDLSLLPAGETTANVFAGFHMDAAFGSTDDLWTRITLTTEPVPVVGGEWDGSGPLGGFARGETEDHLLDAFESELDPDGNIVLPPGFGGFGPKAGIVPTTVKWTPAKPVFDGRHALTPSGPGALAPVATISFNMPVAATNPANALGGGALIGWTRLCDIGGGDCFHLLPEGPNPVNAVIPGVVAMPGVGAIAVGATGALAAGVNTFPVNARFPNKINGDTHGRLAVVIDPLDTYYMTVEMDDCLLYPDSGDCLATATHFTAMPEPGSLTLLVMGLLGFAGARQLRRMIISI